MLICCNKTDKIVSDDIKNSNDTIQTQILKEISDNKNEKVFLSFYPNMSDYVFEYLLEKEKNNGNISNSSDYSYNDKYKITLKDTILNFSIYNIENAIKLNYSYQFWNEEIKKEDIDIGMNNYLKIIDELVKLYKSKYNKFAVKKNIIGSKSMNIEDLMTCSDDYLVFYDPKKIIVFSSNFDHRQRILDRMGRDDNKYKVYSYDMSINYYSIDSFNKMRHEKIKDSLEYLQKIENENKSKIENKSKEINKNLNDI